MKKTGHKKRGKKYCPQKFNQIKLLTKIARPIHHKKIKNKIMLLLNRNLN